MTKKTFYIDAGNAVIDHRTDEERPQRMYRWAFRHNPTLWQIGGVRAINRSQAMFIMAINADEVALSLKLLVKEQANGNG